MTAPTDPEATAAVLRRRLVTAPLWLPVAGSSMGRAIPTGARVLVESRPAPRRGEVWAFCTETGAVYVHRFLRRAGDQLWFRGDANSEVDVPIPAGLLVGRVVVTEVDGRGRRLGRLATLRGRARADAAAVGRRARARLSRRTHGRGRA